MKKQSIQLLVAVCVLVVFFVGERALETRVFGLLPPTLETHANAVIRLCERDAYPPGCYDRELPKLMDQGLSMEDAFVVAGIIQSKIDDYFYCHVLGHNLSAKETAKDPAKWTDVVARCPVGMCSNGCLHGAAQERYRNDVLSDAEIEDVLPELAVTCKSREGRIFTRLEEASCDHSLGHLAMYITGADPMKSTALCDRIAEPYVSSCYEGAFMQIFQPLEVEDFALVKDIPATTTALAESYCDSFPEEQRGACHRESWPLYRTEIEKPEGLAAFCSLMPGKDYVDSCYYAMFYAITAQVNFDQEKIISLCLNLDDERKSQCFANSASRFLETDYHLTAQAVALCDVAEQEGVGERCYDELLYYSGFNFHQGSDAFYTLCRALPEPWEKRCLAGEGSTMLLNKGD